MADKYSVVINSKDPSGKSLSKTISSINPSAQPSDLKAMAQGLNALTKNTYDSAERVARENVDTASDKTVPAAATLVVKNKNSSVTVSSANEYTATLTSASFDNTTKISVVANNVGKSYLGRPYLDNMTTTSQSGVIADTPVSCYISSSSWTLLMSVGSNEANQTISADVIYPAIDNYASNTQHVTIIIGEGE